MQVNMFQMILKLRNISQRTKALTKGKKSINMITLKLTSHVNSRTFHFNV